MPNICQTHFTHWTCPRVGDRVPALMELTLLSAFTARRKGAAASLWEVCGPMVHCSSWRSLKKLVCPNPYWLLLSQFPTWPLGGFELQLCHYRLRTFWFFTVRTGLISGSQPPSSQMQSLAVRGGIKWGFVIRTDVWGDTFRQSGDIADHSRGMSEVGDAGGGGRATLIGESDYVI